MSFLPVEAAIWSPLRWFFTLEHRIGTQPVGVVAVLVAGGDHLHAEADHVGQAVDDLTGVARIIDAARQTLGDPQPLLDLGQCQNEPFDDSMPPSKQAITDLPRTEDNRSAAV
jgi:hypothetical protein